MQYVLLVLILICMSALWVFASRRLKRRALLAAPLSADDWDILFEQVPLLRQVPEEIRKRLDGKINLFLAQVEFVGCDGLEVTHEMRLSIAGQACLLLVNTDAWYKHLRTILMYPGAFQSLQQRQQGYVVTENNQVRLGESWSYGPVVLSWQHSEFGAAREDDGKNVVIHEFAHQLDQLSGHTDGAPLMNRGQSFAEWERVILDAYEAHVRAVNAGRAGVLDPYGATAHEEFFAVASEAFFETPVQLKREEPEVYEQLVLLYKLDPANWSGDAAQG